MHTVLIYTANVTGGKPFMGALRRLAKKELHTWSVLKSQPLTLAHSQRAGVEVTFALAGSTRFKKITRGYRVLPEPAVAALVSGATADQVLGFLTGMLARRAAELGVALVIIPMGVR